VCVCVWGRLHVHMHVSVRAGVCGCLHERRACASHLCVRVCVCIRAPVLNTHLPVTASVSATYARRNWPILGGLPAICPPGLQLFTLVGLALSLYLSASSEVPSMAFAVFFLYYSFCRLRLAVSQVRRRWPTRLHSMNLIKHKVQARPEVQPAGRPKPSTALTGPRSCMQKDVH